MSVLYDEIIVCLAIVGPIVTAYPRSISALAVDQLAADVEPEGSLDVMVDPLPAVVTLRLVEGGQVVGEAGGRVGHAAATVLHLLDGTGGCVTPSEGVETVRVVHQLWQGVRVIGALKVDPGLYVTFVAAWLLTN